MDELYYFIVHKVYKVVALPLKVDKIGKCPLDRVCRTSFQLATQAASNETIAAFIDFINLID